MAVYRVTIKRTYYLEAEIEAESAEDARDDASGVGHDWRDANSGRGLGDDMEVLDVEDISDEYEAEAEDENS